MGAIVLASAVAVAQLPATPVSADPNGSCGWYARFDPNVVNAAFPDQSANYFLLHLPAAPGETLTFHGRFPHARYMSFHTYDGQTAAVDHVYDAQIVPDPGSSNPFLSGASRTTPLQQREYTVTAVFGQRPAAAPANTFYTTDASGAHQGRDFNIIYRIYIPDQGTDVTGGVGLPEVTVNLPGGSSYQVPDCQHPSMPDTGLNQAVANGSLPGMSNFNFPGLNPPVWHKFYNTGTSVAQAFENGSSGESIANMFICPPPSPSNPPYCTTSRPSGGFVENKDNNYVYAFINAGDPKGPVVVFKALLPTFPNTYPDAATMGAGQLRYWSMCSNDPHSTRFYGCVADYQAVTDATGAYTVVISTEQNRPQHATQKCGYNWLPFGPGFDDVVIMRNMLPDPTFTNAIQNATLGTEQAALGPYYPAGKYMTVKEFQKLGCSASKMATAGAAGAGPARLAARPPASSAPVAPVRPVETGPAPPLRIADYSSRLRGSPAAPASLLFALAAMAMISGVWWVRRRKPQ